MFQKIFLTSIFTAAIFLIGTSATMAQYAPVTGRVELEKADGSKVPVAGALVEVFRVDIKASFPSDKTDKKGNFSFAGLPLGAKFVLSVSAPGAKPGYLPNVKAGDEKLLITLKEGDGKKWTEEEIRSAIAQGNTAAATNKTGETSAEDKKAEAERQKQVAEYEAKKKKAEDTNKTVNAALKEGDQAFQAKNYDLAISKFDEGVAADPDFEGSSPILLNYKGVAHRERGIAAIRQAANGDADAKAAAFAKAKADYSSAIAAFDRGLEIIKNAPTGDANMTASLATSKLNIYSNYMALHGTMAKLRLDPIATQKASVILEQYLPLETDVKKKNDTLMVWATHMRESGETKNAIAAYRIILESSPDNLDAMAGIGLSLFAEGVAVVPENKEQMQEGLNYMQKFADTAPDIHPLKASVKESLDYLKNTAKLAPQKVAPGKKKN